jgi:hypothetical protein
MRKMSTKMFLSGLVFILASLTVNAQINRYVKEGGTGDGTSWENASGDLQAMVDEVGQGGLVGDGPNASKGTVHVAAGTYKGKTFNMRQGVHVFGGYPANGGDKRNPVHNQTILDGEKTRRVLYQSESDDQWTINTIWDGFYIQNGKASYGAGAILCLRGVLRNCIIRNNHATTENNGLGQGGGVMMKKVNSATQNRTGLLLNCVVVNNTADKQGAGVFFAGSSTGSITNTIIAFNDSGEGCGGMHMSSGSRWARLHNSIVWGNFGPAGYQVWTPATGEKLEDKKNNIIEDGLAPDSFNNASCTGNILDVPKFKNPTTFTGIATTEEKWQELANASWEPQSGAPGIDKGIMVNVILATNESEKFLDWMPTDILGNARWNQDTVDIGAFEYFVDTTNSPLVEVNNLQIYPNPVRNLLTVSGITAGDRVLVINLMGATLVNRVAGNETEYIDMNDFKNGIYMISVERKSSRSVQKIVKY